MSPLLSSYDPNWPALFEEEASQIREALEPGLVAIEHVGSTSVPGLRAKPTVDIAVGVESLELKLNAHLGMEALGYSYGGTHDRRQHVFRKGSAVPWRVLVHVVEYGGAMWLDFLFLRDYLRAHPVDADRYGALKASLLEGRADWYSGRDKQSFIQSILEGRCR